jgi:hypothetical protein
MREKRSWLTPALDDSGSALLSVIGIMVVISVFAIAAFVIESGNLSQSQYERQRIQALNVAEAGIDAAFYKVTKVTPPMTLPFSFTIATADGTVTVKVTQGSTSSWTNIVASGASALNPKVTRTLSTEVFRFAGIWNMVFSSGNGVGVPSNGHINGSASFYGAMYMNGDWPDSNGNSSYNGGAFYVHNGAIHLGGSSSIGSLGKVDLYCETTPTGSVTCTWHPNVPVIPLPTFGQSDLMNALAEAKAESIDGLMGDPQTTETYNQENDTLANRSNIATGMPAAYAPRSGFYKVIVSSSTVTIGGAEASWGMPPTGTPYPKSPDDFAWDATNRVLTVQGTVYIDAPSVVVDNVHFAGKGTIVCTHNVTIQNAFEPYSGTNLTGRTVADGSNVYPAINCLGFTTPETISEFSPNGFGVLYAGTVCTFNGGGNGNAFHGACMSPTIDFGKHMDIWVPTTIQANLPPSMPGNDPSGIISTSGYHEGLNH